MIVKVTEQGILIPKDLLWGLEEVELRMTRNAIVVSAPGADPILETGQHLVVADVVDASVSHDFHRSTECKIPMTPSHQPAWSYLDPRFHKVAVGEVNSIAAPTLQQLLDALQDFFDEDRSSPYCQGELETMYPDATLRFGLESSPGLGDGPWYCLTTWEASQQEPAVRLKLEKFDDWENWYEPEWACEAEDLRYPAAFECWALMFAGEVEELREKLTGQS